MTQSTSAARRLPFPPVRMKAVLAELHNCFKIAPEAEISVETSATGLSDEMIGVLKEGGVNRLSVGIQTFDDGAKKLFGRRGSGEFAASRVATALHACHRKIAHAFQARLLPEDKPDCRFRSKFLPCLWRKKRLKSGPPRLAFWQGL